MLRSTSIPYVEWDRDVNLAPSTVSGQQQEMSDILRTKEQYDLLQYTLLQTNYPETEDRTANPRTKRHQSETGITIAIVSSPDECLPILIRGGQSCPGNVHLVLSQSWLSVEPSDRDPKLKTVFLHTAISMYPGGCSYLDRFDPPRRVTYLMNNLADSNLNENEFDCPTSVAVNTNSDDVIRTRITMSKCGIRYPQSLAFVNELRQEYDMPEKSDIEVENVDSEDDVLNVVSKGIDRFLVGIESKDNQVVVKPIKRKSNANTTSISIHDGSDRENIRNRMVTILSQCKPGDGALIEKFCYPGQTAAGESDLSFRVRVITCMGRRDEPIATSVICRIGRKNEPITGENTTSQSLDTTLRQWGVDEGECERIRKLLMSDSEHLLRQIILQENNSNGFNNIQTDMIGVDYTLTKIDGHYVPVCIAVKNRRQLSSYQMYDFMNREADLRFGSISPLVERMCEMSQVYLMRGKTIVVIAKGRSSKAYMWNVAKEDDIKIVLVDIKSGDIPAVAYDFVDYDFTDHSRDEEHASNISQLLLAKNYKIDGCCTVTEDCVPICARICEILSLSGNSLAGATTAKKKSSTLRRIYESYGGHRHFPAPRIYSDKCVRVESEEDIDRATISFPCVIKREFGGGAAGVELVNSVNECKNYYNYFKTKLETVEDIPVTGKGFGTSMLIMKYLEGTEHDVNVVMYKRRLIAAFAADNGPTRSGSFFETSVCLPSCLPRDKRDQLITAAYQCCATAGLSTGVFHVEMMMTRTGPKLIEINPRMGGFYAGNWLKECYGIDMVRCIYMCAGGVQPHVHGATPRGQFMGVTCLQSLHSHLWKRMDEIRALHARGDIRFSLIETYDAEDEVDPDTEIHIGYLGVRAERLDEAKDKLLKVSRHLGIDCEGYDVEKYIDFRPI